MQDSDSFAAIRKVTKLSLMLILLRATMHTVSLCQTLHVDTKAKAKKHGKENLGCLFTNQDRK